MTAGTARTSAHLANAVAATWQIGDVLVEPSALLHDQDPRPTLTSRFDRPLRLECRTEKEFSPPGAGLPRCAGSAAPAGRRSPPARRGRGGGRSAGRARSPPSAPLGTCQPVARTRTARPQ